MFINKKEWQSLPTVWVYLSTVFMLGWLSQRLESVKFDDTFELDVFSWHSVGWFVVGSSWALCGATGVLGRNLERSMITNSITHALLLIVPIIVGLYGSVTSFAFLEWLFPKEGAALPPQYGVHYLVVAILAVVMVAVRYSVLSASVRRDYEKEVRERDEAQSTRQREDTKLLKEVIELAPPKSFPSELAKTSDIMEDFAHDVTKSMDEYEDSVAALTDEGAIAKKWEDECKYQLEIIRCALMAFTHLAARYDNSSIGASSKNQYRANLMLSFDVSGEDREMDERVMEIFMAGEKPDKRYNLGFNSVPKFKLALNKHYSVHLQHDEAKLVVEADEAKNGNGYEHEKFSYDKDVCSAEFPVYMDDEDDGRYVNVYGAPIAISTCHYTYVPDTLKKAQAMQEAGYGAPLIKEAVEYASQDKKGRSILSLPLSNRRFLSAHLKPSSMVGTINIYRNEPNMFRGDEIKAISFADFTLPLQVALSRIVIEHVYLHQLKPGANLAKVGELDYDTAIQREEGSNEN